MAGGIGSRFWPMSTPEHPKQFLDVLGIGKSLIQMTFDRLKKLAPAENIFVLTNESYKDLVLNQLKEIDASQVLTEPQRKNTAPCIAYAAAKIYSLNPEAVLVVSPADHLILQEDNFISTIDLAIESAESGRIATIGIQPTRPDTGYGYIEFEANAGAQVIPVKQFREKPDIETAKKFVDAGTFYWNSGIFVWKAKTALEALEEFQPSLCKLFTSEIHKYNTTEEQSYVDAAFNACEDISIDYAVMEHAKNIDVVLSSFDWSDLGTWGSLDEHLKKDEKNNAVIGDQAYLFNSANCIINLPDDQIAVIDGLDGYIVIQSDNRLMILRKENEQELKNFVKKTQ